jgi:hypothetical protein
MKLSVGSPATSFKQLSDGSYENSDQGPQWVDFFGEPVRGDGRIPRSQEVYDLPDAYYGSNLYMSTVMVNEITKDEAFFVSEVLPWEQADGKLSLTWDEWRFDDFMVDRQPEESVSRLLSSQKSGSTIHFQRYGIGFMLEHGFMTTREGILNYAMNIQQIKNAVVETMCLGVALTVLTCPPPLDPYNKFAGVGPLNQHQFERRIQDEIDMFGIVHKSDTGFYIAYDRLRRIMKDRGVNNANYMIIPDGVSKYVAMTPGQTMALYSGKPTNGGPGAGIIDNPIYGGLTIRESRPFIMGEKRPNWDPFFRMVVIGGFTHNLAHHLRGVPVQDYRSEMRDRFVYDEKVDDEVRITLAQDLQNCGLFDFSDTDLLLEDSNSPPRHPPSRSSSSPSFPEVPLTLLGKEYFSRYPNYYVLLQQSNTLDDILKMLSCNSQLIRELQDIFKLGKKQPSPKPARPGPGQAPGGSGRSSGDVPRKEASEESLFKINNFFERLEALRIDCTAWKKNLQKVKALFKYLKSDQSEKLTTEVLAAGLHAVNEDKVQDVATFSYIEEKKVSSGPMPMPYVPLFRFAAKDTTDYDRRTITTTFGDDEASGAQQQAATAFVSDADTQIYAARDPKLRDDETEPLAKLWKIASLDQDQKVGNLTDVDVAQLKKVGDALDEKKWIDSNLKVDLSKCPYNYIGIAAAVALVSTSNLSKAMLTTEIRRAFEDLRNCVKNLKQSELVSIESHHRQELVHPDDPKKRILVDSRVAAGFRYNEDAARSAFRYIETGPAVKLQKLGKDVLGDYRDVVTDVMAAFHDSAEDTNDFNQTLGFWLLLLAFMCKCREGQKGKPWQAWSDAIIDAFVSESPVNKTVFKFAFQQMNDDRMRLNRRLTSDFIEEKMGTDPEAGIPATLTMTMTEIGNKQTIERNIANNKIEEEKREKKAEEEKRDSKCQCSTCPCHCEYAQKMRELLIKIFKNKPITEGAFFWWCYKRDLPCPLGFLCFRPMMRYTMGTAVLMVPGRATGSSYMSHADFQLGDDVTRKMHIGNFTFYAKPAIRVPKNVAFAPNIYGVDYNGGNGTNYWQYNEVDRDRLKNGDIEDRDMFCVAVPLEYIPPKFVDLTGQYDAEICNDVNDDSALQYPTARLYRSYWNFAHQKGGDRFDPEGRVIDQVPVNNTLCVQDHQRIFSYHGDSKGRWDRVITNKGHW